MSLRTRLVLASTLIPLAAAAPAKTDPCEGVLPSRAGQQFAGTVRYVGDGDNLCVGSTSDPADWIEVRLADFDAPELHAPGGAKAKDLLRTLVLGEPVACVASRGRSGRVIVYDRVIATCRIRGQRVGDLLRHSGAREGGN